MEDARSMFDRLDSTHLSNSETLLSCRSVIDSMQIARSAIQEAGAIPNQLEVIRIASRPTMGVMDQLLSEQRAIREAGAFCRELEVIRSANRPTLGVMEKLLSEQKVIREAGAFRSQLEEIRNASRLTAGIMEQMHVARDLIREAGAFSRQLDELRNTHRETKGVMEGMQVARDMFREAVEPLRSTKALLSFHQTCIERFEDIRRSTVAIRNAGALTPALNAARNLAELSLLCQPEATPFELQRRVDALETLSSKVAELELHNSDYDDTCEGEFDVETGGRISSILIDSCQDKHGGADLDDLTSKIDQCVSLLSSLQPSLLRIYFHGILCNLITNMLWSAGVSLCGMLACSVIESSTCNDKLRKNTTQTEDLVPVENAFSDDNYESVLDIETIAIDIDPKLSFPESKPQVPTPESKAVD